MALNKRMRRVPFNQVSAKTYPELTFEQAIELVISAKRAEGLRDRTLKDYAKHYGYFIDWLRENYPEARNVSDITTPLVRDHIAYMKHDRQRYSGHKYIDAESQRVGLSDTTVNIRLRTLKAIFNQLERDELIVENPMTKIKQLRQDVDLTNCFTDDEVKAILAQPNQRDFVGFRDYCAIMLMLDAGIRISELLGLRMQDIDIKTRFIALSGEVNKNRKPRLVPISGYTAKLLLQLHEENKRHFTTDRLFLSVYGDPIGPNHFNKRLKYYAEKAGIADKKMTAHVWRHTWAKGMVTNGADPFTIQKMGGWADIRTMRRYIQMDTEDMRRSHDKHSPAGNFVRKRV
ncbi:MULTISPECIES: tyrosine-type recombinase/integrase [Paenibacillus]|uniref:tyrosine-type recombinase/integrase n=1 Tax=Paenibacillus TaxID=44249 RepID=UPI0004099777|nr:MULTISPECIES: tyrosine-type recombinase/integrase [Paenibacillus]